MAKSFNGKRLGARPTKDVVPTKILVGESNWLVRETITSDLAQSVQCDLWAENRFRILRDEIAEEFSKLIKSFTDHQRGKFVELSVQVDHLRLRVMLPPEVPILKFAGTITGRTAVWILNQRKEFGKKLHWGDQFFKRGYCVDAIGLDEGSVRKYVRHQDW